MAPATSQMEPTKANMSVRSAPAEVPAEEEQAWRAAIREAEENAQMGGGGGRAVPGAHDDPFVAWTEEQSDRMSPDQAQRLIKGMLNAGIRADPEDPCARFIAMMEHVKGDVSAEEEASIRRRCRGMPRALTGCLKPENERTPYERRSCRRFLTGPDEDIPDIFGTNGAAIMRGGHSAGLGGPERLEGPVPEE